MATDQVAAPDIELDFLCNTVQEGIFIFEESKDADGFVIEWVNAAGTRIYGYSREEFIGQKLGLLGGDKAQGEVYAKRLIQNLKMGLPFRGELELRTKSGESVWSDVRFQPMPEKPGSRTRWVAFHKPLGRERELKGGLKQMAESVGFITNSAPICLLAVGFNRVIRHVAGGILGRLGWEVGSMVGKSVDDVLAKESELLHDIQFALQGDHQTRSYTIAGRHLEARFSAFEGPQSEPIGVICLLTDISDRIESRKISQRMELLLEGTPDVVFFDDGQKVLYMNPSGYRLLDAEPGVFVGERLDILDPHGEMEAAREHAQKEGVWSGELSLWNRKGTPIICSMVIVSKSQGSFYASIARDIREAKAAEHNLMHVRKRAEAATQAKSEFLANMSHEIRTPLNAILGFAQILESSGLDSESMDYVQVIRKSGQNLLALIGDILDFSKIESGKLELDYKAFYLKELFDELRAVFELSVKEKGLRLEFEFGHGVPSQIELDPARLRQVLFNLIGNSIKYTDSGFVQCHVRTVRDAVSSGKVDLVIEIRDTGRGISKADQDGIFETFVQKGSKRDGVGLGLAITARLVEMMQGEVHVQSEPEKGSIFSVYLPQVEVVGTSFIEGSLEEDLGSVQRLKGRVFYLQSPELKAPHSSDIEAMESSGLALSIGDKLPNSLEGFECVVVDYVPSMGELTELWDAIKASNTAIPVVALVDRGEGLGIDPSLSLGFDALVYRPFGPAVLARKLAPLVHAVGGANGSFEGRSGPLADGLYSMLQEHKLRWEALEGRLVMGELKAFAQVLRDDSQLYACERFMTWLKGFEGAIEAYDVSKIQAHMDQFAAWLKAE